jgi:endo-1,4-beta-xylanase
VITIVFMVANVHGGSAVQDKQPPRKTPPKAAWLDPNRGEPNGTKYRSFPSKVAGTDVSYLIYLPPDYVKQTRRYPVIYWLHGLNGNQRGGAAMFVPHVDQAIRKGFLPPAIVVSVNGMVNSFYCDWAGGKRPMESVIIKDLIGHIDQTYRSIAGREGRVVQGYSMGGYGAAHLGFKYPEVFGTVVVDAGALVREKVMKGPKVGPLLQEIFGGSTERFLAEHPTHLLAANADKIRNKTSIRIGCGVKDNLLPLNRALHQQLEELKIAHEFELVPDVAHESAKYYRALGNKGLEIHRKAFAALDSAPAQK